MKITNTQNNLLSNFNSNLLNLSETTKKSSDKSFSTIENAQTISSWQKDIIQQTIEKLENTQLVENNHPLSKTQNAPIETFEEALNVLNYFKSTFYKSEASAVQANLEPKDISSLFTEN
jgi:hypothetical protein